MTIRTRLTVLFTAVVSVLWLVFCLIIYLLAERHRRDQFNERLRAEATTSVELLFGKETVSPELFKLLDKNHLTVLNDEEIIIYNDSDSLVYESGTDYLKVDKALLNRIRLENEVYRKDGPREVIGILFTDSHNRFIVFASAIDKYGVSEVTNLLWVLAVGWFFSGFVVFWVGWFYAYRALLPLVKLIGRVDTITASRLDLRVEVTDPHDEIGQLAERFNRMLDRLEEAFQLQRAFVSNASHELRTPLTAITGQIEVALMDNNPQEWHETLRSVLEDARQLNRLSNGLLSLAKVSMDESAVKLSEIYLDEVFWQVRSELLRAYPAYTVKVNLANFSIESTHFMVLGNESLLQIAITNLLENGAKFSPNHTVEVSFADFSQAVEIHFHNRGPAIPEEELPLIFKPFHRGSNSRMIDGHGIGLSLTERIIKLHHGSLSVESSDDHGTVFVITLPKKS
ncbi:MAG: ATP-binding protein [Spirosomataceae bacterium]